LPLFNRNQDSIASAIAELEANKIREELLKKSVLNEVNILFERLTSLNARINDLMEQIKTSKEITGIVSLLYEEGEASLIEMLDAARLDAELTIERNNLIYEYLTALFELQKAVGTRYLNTGGAR
jgi:outer membrane protein TolC